VQANLIEDLFTEAIEIPSESRSQFIQTANCPDDIKEEVSQLVRAWEQSSPLLNTDLVSDLQKISPKFLDTKSDSISDTVVKQNLNDEATLVCGQRVGNYVVEDVLGSGGMSVVYKAKQTEPIKRSVAIKVIRRSNTTPTSLKRFFREQQVVAIMRHQNIAALYEVTQTREGKPVAVMEYIRGRSITDFCDRHQLNWKHRIVVFLKVCRGLAHAHRHGVVHRDVKPDNILVSVEDRKPVPKLIDFGIAAITKTDFDKELSLTRTGQMIGSPRYMSPEQFQSSNTVDHRSDIYSAALVLFELLARVPFRECNTAGELMANCDAEPDRLSDRILQAVQDHGEQIFQGKSPEALAKFARKDLDWILNKALARDPEDRYADVSAFFDDLRAAMSGQPVSVSAPSIAVRSGRFLTRHWRQIWIGSSLALILMLVVGLGQRWNAADDLSRARLEQTKQEQKTDAANDLVMKLLASDEYQLTPSQFDLDLVPTYRANYQQIRANGGPKTKQDRFVYGILAVMEAMNGDFDQAETLMATADSERGNDELRKVRSKICEQYAQSAKVRLGQLDAEKLSFEKSVQQMTLARCYFVWGMYDDGEQLLEDAIDYFESEQPRCYESLVARLALVRILQKSGKLDKMKDQLLLAKQRFQDEQDLLSSRRGKEAWLAITGLVDKL